MNKLPDSGFIALIAKLKQERAEKPAPIAKPVDQRQLMALTQDGKVMPFKVWAKRWSDENIDGRRRV